MIQADEEHNKSEFRCSGRYRLFIQGRCVEYLICAKRERCSRYVFRNSLGAQGTNYVTYSCIKDFRKCDKVKKIT